MPLLLRTAISVLLAVPALHAQEDLVPDLAFPRGAQGWTHWTPGVAHAWEVEPAGGPEGQPTLLIQARDTSHDMMVMTRTEQLKPGSRYSLEVWWKLEEMSPGSRVDLRVIYRGAEDRWLTGDDLFPYRSERQGDWTVKHYRLLPPQGTVSSAIGIWVREATGVVRVSGMKLSSLPPGQRSFDSMYEYDPHQVELGMTPLNAYYALRAEKSPFIPRAARWNELLVELAYWQEDFGRARRAALYAGKPETELAGHRQALEQALEDLDELQKSYGRLYTAKDEEGLAAGFDAAAAKLTEDAAAGHAALRGELAGILPALEGTWLDIPRAPVDEPWWDPVQRRPRYMLWVRWSDAAFHDLEMPLNMGDAFTLTAGTPKAFTQGVADWQNYLDQQAKYEAAGVKRFSLITHYALHDKGYLAGEFARAQDNDPDLRMWDAQGEPMGPESGTVLLNWLNPAAREHMVDVLTQMAGFFKPRTEHQFYIDAWESAGPYANGVRIGNNPTHEADFQRYLRERYGELDTLNALWDTSYDSFEAIKPAPDAAPAGTERASAHFIETQRWSQETYIDYLKLIRESIAGVDDTKPVITQHSGLLSRIFSPRVFDAADILGHHNRAATTMPAQLWMTSLQRYSGKPTALFENFWGCQEDHPRRLMDEKAMRAQMRRYMYRHAAWGRCMQTWWYAYTSAPYLLTYNGNWFNPVYDLTTFRYSAAGFPVEKQKVDKLEALILGSEIVPQRVLLVQPYSSMLAQRFPGDTYREWLQWHELLFPRNLLYEALPDTWIAEGKVKLEDFDVVILPVAPYLERGVSARLIEFIRKGGLCVSSGAPGLYDDQARPDGSLLQAASIAARATNAPGQPWEYSCDKALSASGWVEGQIGRGRLVMLPRSLSRMEAGEELARLVRDGSVPAAEAPGTTLELLLRRLPDGRHLLCVLNRDPDEPATGEIHLRGEFEAVADIDMPRPVSVPHRVDAGRTAFATTVDPGATAYYLAAGE